MATSINTAYFDNLVSQISQIGDCTELNAEAKKAAQFLIDKQKQLQQVMDDLAPFLELIENPAAELPKIVAWIKKYIEASVAPKVAAYEQAVQDITTLAQQTARVVAAVQEAENRIVSCVVSLPSEVLGGGNSSP